MSDVSVTQVTDLRDAQDGNMEETAVITDVQEKATLATEEASSIDNLLATAGVKVNGPEPWDLQVHDKRFFRRVLAEGSLGLGESYMDGWWHAEALDEFFARVKRAKLHKAAAPWDSLWPAMKARLANLQTKRLSQRVAKRHYDLGNDLFHVMLDSRMQYSCGYWQRATTLEQAQYDKLDLICRKLHLQPGMRILEFGGGFGGFASFAASEYKCEVVSYNISKAQVAFAKIFCRNLPVRIELKDYREALEERGQFERIVSVGLCEHIGYKNYRMFFELAASKLASGGLFLLHTIGGNESCTRTDPWLDRYIFPNGMLPSIAQLGAAMENNFVVEDWHNFGPDYDKTLMAWWRNFDESWHELSSKYDKRFYRMWKYYLLASAGSFRARSQQLWQIVASKGDVASYSRVCGDLSMDTREKAIVSA